MQKIVKEQNLVPTLTSKADPWNTRDTFEARLTSPSSSSSDNPIRQLFYWEITYTTELLACAWNSFVDDLNYN